MAISLCDWWARTRQTMVHFEPIARFIGDTLWSWGVIGWIVAGLLGAWGVMLGISAFTAANWFFAIGAAILFVKIATWAELKTLPLPQRIPIIVVAVVAIGGSLMFELQWVNKKAHAAKMASEPPDITAKFTYPTYPVLQLANVSDHMALAVTYQVTMWNIDSPQNYNPLPIATNHFSYLRPHAFSGPEDIFQPVAQSFKRGTRLFGSVFVDCSNCARGHTFWAYIDWSNGGWFSEITGMKSDGTMVPKALMTGQAPQHFDMGLWANAVMATIPNKQRISITNP
jgi:hypothetical protein